MAFTTSFRDILTEIQRAEPPHNKPLGKQFSHQPLWLSTMYGNNATVYESPNEQATVNRLPKMRALSDLDSCITHFCELIA